jgi:hypothetical protein
MEQGRKYHSPSFKAKTDLEVPLEEETTAEIASQCEVYPSQVTYMGEDPLKGCYWHPWLLPVAMSNWNLNEQSL